MNFSVQLTVDSDVTADDITIVVDDRSAEFTIKNQCIEVLACGVGFHVLRLTNNTHKRFNIGQVKINGCDLRKLIYLSYLENQIEQKFQPATELWESGQTWVLPFGYPVSGWIETVEQRIPNNLLGQNLLDNYCFYYPESIRLENSLLPQTVKDFYEYNFNFTMVDKSVADATKIPYMKYQKEISAELIEVANQEVQDNLEFIESVGTEYGQHNDNLKEFQKSAWRILWLSKKKIKTSEFDKFPCIQKLIDSLDLDYWQAFIGVLPPGGFIYPHKDIDIQTLNNKQYENYRGCTQLYIPLSWPAGNYIKFAGAGTLSFESKKPMVVNTDHFTHSVVNVSDQTRYVLAIRSHNDIINNCSF
jgi:hypothetical protein